MTSQLHYFVQFCHLLSVSSRETKNFPFRATFIFEKFTTNYIFILKPQSNEFPHFQYSNSVTIPTSNQN